MAVSVGALDQPDKLFAEILAAQQADEGLGRIAQSLDHAFPVLEPPLPQPLLEILARGRVARGMIRNDETLQLHAVYQEGPDVFQAVGLGQVVLRNQPAQRDTGRPVQAPQRGVEDLAPDVLEMDVDAVRRRLGQIIRQPARFVVHARVEAEFFDDVAALFGSAGDTDRTAAFDLRDLPDRAPDRAGGGGDDHGFAALRLADVDETDVRGAARHADDAEVRRDRDVGAFDLAHVRAVAHAVRLPPGTRDHFVARLEAGVPRRDDFACGLAFHHLADSDRFGIRFRIVHASAHVRIERKIMVADEELPVADAGDRRLDDVKIALLRCFLRPASQQYLYVFFVHRIPRPTRRGKETDLRPSRSARGGDRRRRTAARSW